MRTAGPPQRKSLLGELAMSLVLKPRISNGRSSDGEAACDLVINLTDPRSNVTSLEISWDVERPTKADAD